MPSVKDIVLVVFYLISFGLPPSAPRREYLMQAPLCIFIQNIPFKNMKWIKVWTIKRLLLQSLLLDRSAGVGCTRRLVNVFCVHSELRGDLQKPEGLGMWIFAVVCFSVSVCPTGGNSTAYCNQNNMMSSHHNFCQFQSSSDQIGSGDGRLTLPPFAFVPWKDVAPSALTLAVPCSHLGSRFSTPRSILKLSKKRALSISPLSDASVDLQTVIRTSPNSLVAFVNSRCNPNGASSYGHLSVSAMRSDLSPFHLKKYPIPHTSKV